MQDLIKLTELIAQALVDNPDGVTVNVVEGEQTSVIELRVAKGDMGKIIGKHGRTAQSIRTILSATSAKLNKRSVLALIE